MGPHSFCGCVPFFSLAACALAPRHLVFDRSPPLACISLEVKQEHLYAVRDTMTQMYMWECKIERERNERDGETERQETEKRERKGDREREERAERAEGAESPPRFEELLSRNPSEAPSLPSFPTKVFSRSVSVSPPPLSLSLPLPPFHPPRRAS